MGIFKKQNEMARDILKNHRGKVLAVVKATRAGATTSLLKQACALKQKTVIVAPYIEIFERTVKDVTKITTGKKPKISRIPANKDACEKIKTRISMRPELGSLSIHYKPSCKGCEYNDPNLCELQGILSEDWDILGLTYAKLRALHVSASETTSQIFRKLGAADNLILDEFVSGIITTGPSMEILEPHSYLENEFGYSDRILELTTSRNLKEATFWAGVAEFAMLAEANGKNLAEGEHKIYENSVPDEYGDFFKDHFAECWKHVERLILERKDTRILQSIVQIIPSKRFVVSKKDDKIRISSLQELDDMASGSKYLRTFLSNYASETKLVALIDACLPDLNLQEDLGVDVEFVKWKDPLDTNKSQMIVCDTRGIGDRAFFREAHLQLRLRNVINLLSNVHNSNTIMIITLNSRMAGTVIAWQKLKQIPKDIIVTYYRSDMTRGITVDPNRRVAILIGPPYPPQIAYLAETYALGDKAKQKQDSFKKSDMRSTFINSIGRVKDPEGRSKSIVYALGVRPYEVKALVLQKDVPSPFIVNFPVQGADAQDFGLVAELFVHTQRDRWKKLEEDLPILARIIRRSHEKKKISCGEIVPNQTEKVQKIVKEYPDILEHYKIKAVSAPRGLSLVYSES